MKKALEDERRGGERKLSPMKEQIILALKVYFDKMFTMAITMKSMLK